MQTPLVPRLPGNVEYLNGISFWTCRRGRVELPRKRGFAVLVVARWSLLQLDLLSGRMHTAYGDSFLLVKEHYAPCTLKCHHSRFSIDFPVRLYRGSAE